MKKILFSVFSLVAILFLIGCSMDNTPTKKVENYLNSYKNLNSDVLEQMDDIMDKDLIMTDAQKNSYRDVLKRQYEDLTYTIKDEVIDGDNATVTTEIEVYDLYKTNLTSDEYYTNNPDEFKDQDGNPDNSLYLDYRIKQLFNATDRIKYTIDFILTKVDNEWVLNDVDTITTQKIHGLYAY